MSAMTILLVDDHTLFRQGLASLLQGYDGVRLIAEASTGAEAVEKACRLTPDLVLMDIHMQGMSGLEALRQIKAHLPDTKVIMLTVSADESDLFEAIKCGAHGYLLKNTSFQELMQTLKGVAAGEAAISGHMAAKIIGEFARLSTSNGNHDTHGNRLTSREEEVLLHVASGASNKTIAADLGISEHTVKKHLRNILQKLQLQNRVQVALYASTLRDRYPQHPDVGSEGAAHI